MAARVLKIGVHLRFDPKFTVEFEHFDQKYFRQAYYTAGPANFYTKAQTYLTTILRRILCLPKSRFSDFQAVKSGMLAKNGGAFEISRLDRALTYRIV